MSTSSPQARRPSKPEGPARARRPQGAALKLVDAPAQAAEALCQSALDEGRERSCAPAVGLPGEAHVRALAAQATEAGLSVQAVAEATGLSAHTLRYYERAGLMPRPVARGEASGHRRYSEEDLRWLGFLQCLRATGMPIADLKRYTELLTEGPSTEAQRLALLQAHQGRVEAQLAETTRHLGAIRRKVAFYEDQGVTAPAR